MADFGIKVSKPGTDVKTGTDANMAFNSKFSIPKAVIYEEIDLDTVGNPYLWEYDVDDTPFVLAFATANGSTNKVMANYFNYNDDDNVQVWISAGSESIRVETAGTPANQKVQLYIIDAEI